MFRVASLTPKWKEKRCPSGRKCGNGRTDGSVTLSLKIMRSLVPATHTQAQAQALQSTTTSTACCYVLDTPPEARHETCTGDNVVQKVSHGGVTGAERGGEAIRGAGRLRDSVAWLHADPRGSLCLQQDLRVRVHHREPAMLHVRHLCHWTPHGARLRGKIQEVALL